MMTPHNRTMKLFVGITDNQWFDFLSAETKYHLHTLSGVDSFSSRDYIVNYDWGMHQSGFIQ